MNVSTKTLLMDLLDAEEKMAREKWNIGDEGQAMSLIRINDARRLVEQGPEEPRR